MHDSIRTDCLIFGEAQSRVIISSAPDKAEMVAAFFSDKGVPCTHIGAVGGNNLTINQCIDVNLAKLSDAYFNALPQLMEAIG